MTQKETLDWVMDILKREANSHLYGSVTIQFQNGAIQVVKIEKTEKPSVDGQKKGG